LNEKRKQNKNKSLIS